MPGFIPCNAPRQRVRKTVMRLPTIAHVSCRSKPAVLPVLGYFANAFQCAPPTAAACFPLNMGYRSIHNRINTMNPPEKNMDSPTSARRSTEHQPGRGPEKRPFRAGSTPQHRNTPSPHKAPRGSGPSPHRPDRGVQGEQGVQGEPPEGPPLLPGVKPVLEFLQNTPGQIDAVYLRKGRHGSEMDEILDSCRKNGIRFSLMEGDAFARLFPGKTQGVVARLFEAGFVDLDALFDSVMDAPLPLLVVLDGVQDPGNAGTLARTLYALGGAGLIVPRHNGVYLGMAAQKAAAGALQKLPVARPGNIGQALDAAKKLGFTLYGAASPTNETGTKAPETASVFSLSPRFPALLVLGSEEAGIPQTHLKRCDFLLGIPMQREFDSLNVAQAGAICIAAFLQAQEENGRL